MKEFLSFEEYLKLAPDFSEVHWWDLSKGIPLILIPFPKNIKRFRESVTVQRLFETFGKNKQIEKSIKFILFKDKKLKFSFPLKLNTVDYAKLYSLMVSEGSKRTEFSIHCPDEEFHDLFKSMINKLLGKAFSDKIIVKKQNGIKRSRALQMVRWLVPVSNHIPKLILKNKKFSQEYLKVAFEAEGSPIFDGKSKRYIKLSRSVDVSDLVNKSLKYEIGKRIYVNKLNKDYPKFYDKILRKPPITLLGENLLLKKYFDIDSVLKFEALRTNKTPVRTGKYSARWILFIYAENITKFVQKIGFISERKNNICKKMIALKTQKSKYSVFKIMKKLSKNHVFLSKDFVKEMKKLGYVSPYAFISKYWKKDFLKKIDKGKYKIISFP